MSQAVQYMSLDFRREVGAGMYIWESDERGYSFLIHKSPRAAWFSFFRIHFFIFPMNVQVTSNFQINSTSCVPKDVSVACNQRLWYILLLSPLYKYGTWSSERLIRNSTKITKIVGAKLDLEPGVFIRYHPSQVRPSLGCCCHGLISKKKPGAPVLFTVTSRWRGERHSFKQKRAALWETWQLPAWISGGISKQQAIVFYSTLCFLYQSLLQCAKTQLMVEYS